MMKTSLRGYIRLYDLTMYIECICESNRNVLKYVLLMFIRRKNNNIYFSFTFIRCMLNEI
jgi:hypothetical protein